jgi:hypothetical protein
LPTTFNQYPLFYDFSTTPHVAQFAQPVTVAICQLEVGAPFGPPTQTVANRLQIAHPNAANPTTLELLPREVVSFIDCSDVSLAQARLEGRGILASTLGTVRDLGARALAPFRPTKLYAVHGGLGGKTTSFSPFGAVDPGPAACPPSAPTGFATVACFSFTTIPGVTHGFFVGSSITLVPSVGLLSADYVLLSPTGFTKLPPSTPMDVNQAQYLFQPELNETTGVWSDVLRIVSPANQPAQQITINVVKPMIVGVCATPMSGVAQTYATMDIAITNVAPGGVIKICPQTIVVPGSYVVMKPVTIEAEIPNNKPVFQVNGPGVQSGFVARSPSLVTFRSLSFTLTNGALSAIDIGGVSGPSLLPWKEVLVENSVFNLQAGIGAAVRVFGSTLANPKATVQGSQMSGGAFPILAFTPSPTSTIEVLNNSFTGVVTVGAVELLQQNNVRVEGNTFTGSACGVACILVGQVSNALVRNNSIVLSAPTTTESGIWFFNSNGTITQNAVTGVGGGGPPSAEGSYAISYAGIVVGAGGANKDPNWITSSNVTITQNTVTNAVAGVRVGGGGITVTGTNNVFSNVHSALRLDNTSATASSVSVSSSDFTTYFRPILFLGASTAPNTITATCNWWGNVLGPQNILAGTPVASYSPWATAPIANGAGGLCNGIADFTISASPSALNILQGGSGNSTVTIVRTNLTSDIALLLGGLPAGMTGSLAPATLTGPTLTSTLTINVASTVAAGSYPLTVQGVGGNLTRTTPLTVTVVVPNVSFSVAPASLSIQQGGSGTTALNVTRVGFAGNITPSVQAILTESGVPANISGGLFVTFNPAIITANSSTLTVNVGATLATGTYNIVIGAPGVPGSPSVTLTVTVGP